MMNPRSWIVVSSVLSALSVPVEAQVTQRVSVSSPGHPANLECWFPSISADGRYVMFRSRARNLVAGDTNGVDDIFVRDRRNGTTERMSVDSSGVEADFGGYDGAISADGRYVAFWSGATQLVSGDTNGAPDVFVRDRVNGTTDRVSVATNGTQGNGPSSFPSISADGRYVVFTSTASNLVPGDGNVGHDVFLRDRASGTTERVSVDSAGQDANGDSDSGGSVVVSNDGRYVAFVSLATNLVGGDTNNGSDVFVRDRQRGATQRVSVSTNGVEGNGYSLWPSISADGRYVAFESQADNLVAGDTNSTVDVFVRDLRNGTTERVSVDSGGGQGNGVSVYPFLFADGGCVAFTSSADNLVPGGTNSAGNVFIHDRGNGTTEVVSLASDGDLVIGGGGFPWLSPDGRFVAFQSDATDLVPGDTNGVTDIFVRDRIGGTSFLGLCDPGVAGVISCPCSNQPAAIGRGCDNSAATGGAILSARGGAFLSSDSLEFTTSGELAGALSILAQGNAPIQSGTVFGQGVRCAGGTLERLYTKSASGGSITAPDFAADDPTISSRSAANGDPIQAGSSRWYFVYYRDPNVPGGCPAASTFNATQSGRVGWLP